MIQSDSNQNPSWTQNQGIPLYVYTQCLGLISALVLFLVCYGMFPRYKYHSYINIDTNRSPHLQPGWCVSYSIKYERLLVSKLYTTLFDMTLFMGPTERPADGMHQLTHKS